MREKLFAVLLLLSFSLQGAISRIASTTATFKDGAGATTSALDTTNATLLVVGYMANRDLSTTVVSDSKGNTWHSATVYSYSDHYVTFYYSWDHGGSALSVGSGHTVSVSQTGYHGALTFVAYSGSLTTSDPYDQHNGGGGEGSSTEQPGSITPSANGSLVLLNVGILLTSITVSSVSDSFSLMTSASLSGEFSTTLADLIQTTAAAINPTITYSSGYHKSPLAIVSFKPAVVVSRRKSLVVIQ